MREYLDRSIDTWWEEQDKKAPKIDGDTKKFVGDQYIMLRGLCLRENIWFEEAVGEACASLPQKEEVQ